MYSFFVEASCGRVFDLHIYDRDGNAVKPFENSRYIIIYDGVLYNEDEVIKALSDAGYSFTPNITEEVIAGAYDMWSEKCLLRLDGDFSFVIWDRVKKELFFARDVYGIRRMFYREGQQSIMLFPETKETDKNTNELTAGHYGIFSADGIKIQSYQKRYMCEASDILYDIFLTTASPLSRLTDAEKINGLIKDAENGSITASRIILYLIRLNRKI